MYCIYVTFLLIYFVNSENLEESLFKYFESDAVKLCTKLWTKTRDWERVVTNLLQQTAGKDIYMTNKVAELKLATGYYHEHGPVKIIFNDLQLAELPRCWQPNVTVSLASNVVKIETKLSKMIITASYKLLRNQSDVIDDIQMQDPYSSSPFLFRPVCNMGKIGLSVENCVLSGYIIATLNTNYIKLGHHKFTLTDCDYIAEIYQPNDMSPPIIAPFSTKKFRPDALELKQLLLKPIGDGIVEKLRGIFKMNIVDELFLKKYKYYQSKQIAVFSKTLKNLTAAVRDLNIKIARRPVVFDDYWVTWDDVIPCNVKYLPALVKKTYRSMMLANMTLTGLDTAFISQTGGPYKLDEIIMIGERIRFSSLQIRGFIQYPSLIDNTYKFSVEITDFDLNIDIELDAVKTHRLLIEPSGARKVEFSQPSIILGDAQELVTNHIINEISAAIRNILSDFVGVSPQITPPHAEIVTKVEDNEDE